MASSTLALDTLRTVVQITAGKADSLMDSCIWCLRHCKHDNGKSIRVVDDSGTETFLITWPEGRVDPEELQRSYNQDDAIEHGAEAIAFLVAVRRTSYTAVERAFTKTGIDYWLGYKDSPNNPFRRAGRLEVSGIMTETEENTVSQRIKKKLKQTKPTDNTFDAYVIVVEFGEPYATMVIKK